MSGVGEKIWLVVDDDPESVSLRFEVASDPESGEAMDRASDIGETVKDRYERQENSYEIIKDAKNT
jgi:hypothetical protein